jgi:CheY-like chemotaxis protein
VGTGNHGGTGCPRCRSNERRPDHILVADDNTDMREYLQRHLAERYRVLAVADGEAALASAREHQPDLILSDIMMPGLDGYALLQRLQGADDYLVKAVRRT